MATFQTQVMGLTSLTISSSSTEPTEAELTQFLTDGAKEIINHLPPHLLKLCTTLTTLTGGDTSAMNTGKVLMVQRSDGDIYHPSRQIPSALSGRAQDPDDMIFAIPTDPAYYTQANNIYSIPEGNPWQYEEVQYPAVAYSDSGIGVFPDEAEHLVVLYASVKSLQNKLSSVVADSDVRNNNQPSATTDVYGAQANEDIELVSSALAITQSELAIDGTQYAWYEKQQAKLQADYEKGLQALVRA